MKEGYKKTELGWIPDEWEVGKFEDILVPRKETFNPKIEENEMYVGLEHIEEVTGRLICTGNSSDTSSIKNKFYNGDILFGKLRPYLRKYYMTDFNGVCVTEILVLTKKKSNNKFCYYSLQQDNFIEYINSKTFGTKMPRTSWNDIKEYPVCIPPLKEQQKIAEILSTVDTQIDDTDKLIEKTKELKKGLMQRLLTKGIGHTEFKITEVGEIPVEWEIITVGKLVTLLKSGLSRSLKEENVGVPCIRSNNIKEDKLVLNDLKYWYNMDDKGAKIEDYILDEGDIIVNFINSISQIGKGCIFNKNDFRTIYTTNLLRIKVDNSKIINTFFYYYIQTERYRKEITLITKPAVNQASFTTVEYKSIKFPVPNLEEQRLISNILVSVDTQIEEYENKKSKLEELKKGLMQKLLTGKIRVV